MTLPLHNGELLDRAKIPQQNVAEFRQQVIARVRERARVAALFGLPGNGSVPVTGRTGQRRVRDAGVGRHGNQR